jgi:CheY-like chemotaxis protein
MNGLDATRAIRALGGRYASVPIIALTANAFAEDVDACFDAGMSNFVVKPVRKDALIATILGALRDVADKPNTSAVSDNQTPRAALSTRPTSVSLVDRSMIDALVTEIGADAAGYSLRLFIDETEGRLALLKRLSIDMDRGAIEHEGHALKGAAATFGFSAVARIAERLEREAASIGTAEYAELLDRLTADFVASRPEMESRLPLAA